MDVSGTLPMQPAETVWNGPKLLANSADADGRQGVLMRALPMPSLPDVLTNTDKKDKVVDDCLALIDAEVADKGGLSGLAIKAGYSAVKGVKPGFVRNAVVDLLPDFAQALDPIFQEGHGQKKTAAEYFVANSSRVADALLAITDAKAQRSKSGVVKGTYEKLRGTAKKNVEAALPRLGKMVDKYAAT